MTILSKSYPFIRLPYPLARAVIRTVGTLVRRFLFAHGFRYRLHIKDLPGNPHIVRNAEREINYR